MSHSKPFARRGFTLLEVVVFLAVASIGVGITLPMLGGGNRGASVERARAEMRMISEAVANYFRDVEAFPASLDNLVTKPVGVNEWMGPYVQNEFTDFESAGSGWNYDPWRTAYQLIVASSTVRVLRCWGPNRTDNSGSSDDFDLIVDSVPIMWELTKEELLAINKAITRYQAVSAPPNLSTTYSTCLASLQSAGYLPSTITSKCDYRTDAWGQSYTTTGNPPTKAKTSGPP